jgi:hypothetical protein
MTKKSEVPTKKRRVGRPSIGGTEQLLVSVIAGTTARIDAVAGAGKRSEFVREAIEREIKRRVRATCR